MRSYAGQMIFTGPGNPVMSDVVVVEIVLALPEVESIIAVTLDSGATASDALEQSGIYKRFSDLGLHDLPIGIWGRVVDRDYVLKTGDRIELYRPLQIDPREARRIKVRDRVPVPFESR